MSPERSRQGLLQSLARRARQLVLATPRRRLTALEGGLAAEIDERERVQRDLVDNAEALGRTSRRIDDLTVEVHRLIMLVDGARAQVAELQLGPRLARLERERARGGSSPAPSPPLEPAAHHDDPAPSRGGFDYLVFEARFRGTEATIADRQRVYIEELRGCRRVVDLGCGRAELVRMLLEAGVDAYGVEAEPDFVELGQAAGLPVQRGDLFAHLAALDSGAVDGIVLSHVVEHLPGHQLSEVVNAARAALNAGGILVIETPNPESLTAGSINFHRDPTHVRPIHPDTLCFMAESAGFDKVAIRRMSPTPATDALPRVTREHPDAQYLNALVDRLDALLYGYQDYAIVAHVTPSTGEEPSS